MSISVRCSQCQSEFKGKEKLAGKKVRCPTCGTTITVPGADEPPALHQPAPIRPVAAPAPAAKLPPLPPVPPTPQEPGWSPPQWTDEEDSAPPAAASLPAVANSSVFGDAERAGLGTRFLGYIIDILPTFLVMIIALIPILGQILAGLLLITYWLLRDIGGASLGKLALGYQVVQANGQPSSGAQRVVRNLPFIIAPLIIMIPIPFVSLVVGSAVGLTVMLTELVFLLATGNRSGDLLAGTRVVKK